MPSKAPKGFIERTTALCYVRLSYTRDGDETNSPERQRANIQALCERNGWIPEWYEDVGGHKSARYEVNRPQWLALKARLGDPDVIALAANDLSRLHRKGWRVGDLIDYLNKYDLNLALAAPGREVDTTTMKGRMFLQFAAIVDEYYAEDISQRAKDHIAYRKGQGKSIGLPPFGTVRNRDGYLIPSADGAWLLPSGQFRVGEPTTPPEDEALWRGYFDAAKRTLEQYVNGNKGLDKIAYDLNREGWAFRDRKGVPRPFERADIRRIVANWPEYGGLVTSKRSKDRPAYEYINLDAIVFREERAVFPLDLLRRVALVRQARTIRPIDQSVKEQAHHYAFSGLLSCSHCERLAQEQNNPKLVSIFTGNTPNKDGIRRYRHKAGVLCGCSNRSVPCEIVERDFRRLVELLTVDAGKIDVITELAIQSDRGYNIQDEENLEQQKQEAIALCRRRIDAAIVLFGDGMITKEEYRRRVELNEREIAHWEARTTETQKRALELALCMEAVDMLIRVWDRGDAEDKQGFVRNLFTKVIFDIDTQQIVDFRLKPWAEEYVRLREVLYESENTDTDKPGTPNGTDSEIQSVEPQGNEMTQILRGGTIRSCPKPPF